MLTRNQRLINIYQNYKLHNQTFYFLVVQELKIRQVKEILMKNFINKNVKFIKEKNQICTIDNTIEKYYLN